MSKSTCSHLYNSPIYGLYDTQDDCWMGDNERGDGPRTFDDPILARLAAEVMDVALGWKRGRIQVRGFAVGKLRLRGKVHLKMTGMDALKGLESGRII